MPAFNPGLSENVEVALSLCGRDRVFHNSGAAPSVGIKADDIAMHGEKWLIEVGGTHDEAGKKAAETFSHHLRERGKMFAGWADSIDAALKGTNR
jgi:hypothetical protein